MSDLSEFFGAAYAGFVPLLNLLKNSVDLSDIFKVASNSSTSCILKRKLCNNPYF